MKQQVAGGTHMRSWRLMRRRVYAIGVEQLWKHWLDERWAVTLDNRTYHGYYEIPGDRVVAWKREFDKGSGGDG